MRVSSPTQPRFPANAGYTIWAGFDGGAMSSDFGALLLHGIDLQIDLMPRWVSAIYGQPTQPSLTPFCQYVTRLSPSTGRQHTAAQGNGYAGSGASNRQGHSRER